VPGFPVFYIVAANSKFREELLKRELDWTFNTFEVTTSCLQSTIKIMKLLQNVTKITALYTI
jgi:hypothetical protein